MLPLLVLALVGEAPPPQSSVLSHLLIGRTSANCSAQVVVVEVVAISMLPLGVNTGGQQLLAEGGDGSDVAGPGVGHLLGHLYLQ